MMDGFGSGPGPKRPVTSMSGYPGGGFGPGQAPPPPPGYPAGPPGYPAGPGPAGYGQYQMVPPQKSSAWKWVLIGCLGIVLVVVVAVAGCSLYVMSKGGSSLMGMWKKAYTMQLAPNHTEEQRQRFNDDIDELFDQESEKGLMKWAEENEKELNFLNQITQDGQISVDESQAFCDMWEDRNGGGVTPSGYGGDYPVAPNRDVQGDPDDGGTGLDYEWTPNKSDDDGDYYQDNDY